MDKKRRIFSDEFKKEKVMGIEAGTLTIAELSRDYSVSSTSIYKWLYLYCVRSTRYRYGNQRKKGVRMLALCYSTRGS